MRERADKQAGRARLRLVAAAGVLVLAGCGGGGGGSDASCSPVPSITSTPSTQATVGVQYVYDVRQVKFCVPFITNCGGVVPGTMPPGAVVDSLDNILWTPAASQAGTTVQFQISTAPDACGGSASQSWTVAVLSPPSIQSFVSSSSAVFPGQSVTLTATFQGTGTISGVGDVLSGIPIVTPPLTSGTNFTLRVTNPMGLSVSQSLGVDVIGPPTIQAFAASPSRIGNGSTSTLSWTVSTQVTSARIDPGNIDVLGVSSLVVTPSANTTYVLSVSNPSGAVSANTLVEVVQNANIQSFTATPTSTGVGGAVQLSAQFLGDGFIDKEANGTFELLAAVSSGNPVSSEPLYRSTRFRLRVQNPSGESISSDVLVSLTGPGTFRLTDNQPAAARRVGHTATVLNDGRLLIAYGISSEGLGHRAEFFDPATETFTLGPTLPAPGQQSLAVFDFLLADGRVLFVRPSDPVATNPRIAIDVYDPVANTFAGLVTGPASIFYSRSAVRLVDGRILAWASITQAGSPVRGVVTFDPATNTFSPFIAFAQQRNYRTSNRLGDDRVLFVAADGASEIFTPGADTFSAGPTFTLARGEFFTAVSLPDGRVLIVGGIVPANAAAEIYDPATDAVQFGGAPFFGNVLHPSAATLADGKVLLVGGLSQSPFGQPLPWAELFDPATGNFTPTGGLRTSRTHPASDSLTRLPDGRVVSIGGCQGSPCEAEIYAP